MPVAPVTSSSTAPSVSVGTGHPVPRAKSHIARSFGFFAPAVTVVSRGAVGRTGTPAVLRRAANVFCRRARGDNYAAASYYF